MKCESCQKIVELLCAMTKVDKDSNRTPQVNACKSCSQIGTQWWVMLNQHINVCSFFPVLWLGSRQPDQCDICNCLFKLKRQNWCLTELCQNCQETYKKNDWCYWVSAVFPSPPIYGQLNKRKDEEMEQKIHNSMSLLYEYSSGWKQKKKKEKTTKNVSKIKKYAILRNVWSKEKAW